MASSPKITNLPYKRLSLEDDDVFGETTRRSSLYSNRFRRVVSLGGRRRMRVRVKIRRLKGYVRKRASRVKLGILKIVKRLKESQSHFGDLFAGNYLFMQVNPSSSVHTKYVFDKSFQGQSCNLPSRLSFPRVLM